MGRLIAGVGAEVLNNNEQHLLTARKLTAQEFDEKDLSPHFRSNGNSKPNNAQYTAMAEKGFDDWMLEVDGLVEQPIKFSLKQFQALPSRTKLHVTFV